MATIYKWRLDEVREKEVSIHLLVKAKVYNDYLEWTLRWDSRETLRIANEYGEVFGNHVGVGWQKMLLILKATSKFTWKVVAGFYRPDESSG